MNLRFLSAVSISMTVAVTLADASVDKELVKSDGRGCWTFSAGPSWRSRVRMETSGTVSTPTPAVRQTIRRDMNDPANWTNPSQVDDPEAGHPPVPAGSKLWGVSDARTEVYGVAGRESSFSASDDAQPLGLNLQAGYDFYQRESWSFGLTLRLAGYWNMRSETQGICDAGARRTESWTDNYIFPNEDPDSPFAPTPYTTIEPNGSVFGGSSLVSCGSRTFTTRLRGDLYQIGLGPKITWSPFVGWCTWMEWLDVYGGVEALCNIAYSRLEADGASGTSTDCRVGFGGNVGFVGNIADWIGIYGQVGYEWVDKTEVSAGSFNADIDYSSLVLSAGLQFRF